MLLQRILNRIWLHKDCQLAPKCGVTYAVQYVGAMSIVVSMKSIDFELRNFVTFQCINLVCEAAGLKLRHNENCDQGMPLSKLISGQPIMEYGGSLVNININTEFISIVKADDDLILAHYNLCNVSFASGGVMNTLHFVAFVAKDNNSIRICHVIQCSKNVAAEVITSIGQAFEISHKNVLAKHENKETKIQSHANMVATELAEESTISTSDVPMRNLSTPVPIGQLVDIEPSSSLPLDQRISWGLYSLPNKVDCLLSEELSDEAEAPELAPRLLEVELQEPCGELWYHSGLSRENAEKLLLLDGDFLVRKKMRAFVLSGRNKGRFLHLLLEKEDGLIRTRENSFTSVTQLVKFYAETQTPLKTKFTKLELYLERAIATSLHFGGVGEGSSGKEMVTEPTS